VGKLKLDTLVKQIKEKINELDKKINRRCLLDDIHIIHLENQKQFLSDLITEE
jgi:hypothetical protein